MKVFISWSGQQSKEIAEELKEWLNYIFQGDPEPWSSAHDISAGERWTYQLGKILEESQVGILCLTKENISSPWILYEAGSIAKSVDSSFVIPYCIGININEIDYPLRQFQAVEANKSGTLKLVQTINQVRTIKIPSENLKHTFETWWPQLNEKLSKIHIIQRMVIIDVGNLTQNIQHVLCEKQKKESKSIIVKVLAADAHQLFFQHIEPLILSTDLKNITFEFCIVDPNYALNEEINPEFSKRALESLKRILTLNNDPYLIKKKVLILSPKTYKYPPNIWGVLVNDSDLFVGFHNWIASNRLEGTQHGIIYLTSIDPLWERFYSLFISWFEHSNVYNVSQ